VKCKYGAGVNYGEGSITENYQKCKLLTEDNEKEELVLYNSDYE